LEKIPPNFDITKLKEKALFVTLGMGHGLRSGSEHSGEEDVCMLRPGLSRGISTDTWFESCVGEEGRKEALS
jgi:hypothetical protein